MPKFIKNAFFSAFLHPLVYRLMEYRSKDTAESRHCISPQFGKFFNRLDLIMILKYEILKTIRVFR